MRLKKALKTKLKEIPADATCCFFDCNEKATGRIFNQFFCSEHYFEKRKLIHIKNKFKKQLKETGTLICN